MPQPGALYGIKMLRIIALLLILVNLLPGQTDSLDVLDYYPLAVGNRWKYAQYDYLGNFQTYITYTVTKDTILAKKHYYIFSNGQYIRIDTTQLAVYYYSTIFDFDTLEYKLDITAIDTEECYLGRMNEFSGGFGKIGCIPNSVPYKYYEYFWLDEYHDYRLYKGFGLGYTRSAYFIQPWCYTERILIAAQIGDSTYGDFTSIMNEEKLINEYRLIQNYPNPFNTSTTIVYNLVEMCEIDISVYDINGKEVENLYSGIQFSGLHHIFWDSPDISAGIYFIRMKSSNNCSVLKCIYLK